MEEETSIFSNINELPTIGDAETSSEENEELLNVEIPDEEETQDVTIDTDDASIFSSADKLPTIGGLEAPSVVGTENIVRETLNDNGEVMELDARLASQIDQGLGDAQAYQDDAMKDAQTQIDNYNIRFANAQAYDEKYGTQTALTMPKPQGTELTSTLAETRGQHFKDAVSDINNMLNGSNVIRSSMASAMLDKGMKATDINAIINGAEFTPFVGAAMGLMDVPENFRQAKLFYDRGEYGEAAKYVGINTVEMVASALGTGAVVRKGKKLLKGEVSEQMTSILKADAETVAAKRLAAKKVAADNKALSQQLIKEFEESTGKVISTGKEGSKVIDGNLARIAGKEVSKDVVELQTSIAERYAKIENSGVSGSNISKNERLRKQREKDALYKETGVSETQAYSGMTDEVDDLVSPLLIPEKFDAIVAVASDFKKANPNEFKKGESIVDSLFRLTVDNKLVESQDLADSLAKYGLTFDDYVLTVVGSGSEAGKILNKLSQIRRAGSLDEIANAQERMIEKGQSEIVKAWRRVENMRRGTMVSMIKTAARNFQSAMIRTPMEALENVFDTTLYKMSQEFAGAADSGKVVAGARATFTGAKTLVSPSNWKGSTRALKRIYANPVQAKEITDYLLDRPEFSKQFTSLFDNINEYQTATGRGKGGATDFVLSRGEDVVNMLNVPNRIQEFVIRRGVFMGELERLVLRDYGVELMDVLKKGDLNELMSNSSKYRPKGKPQFAQLIEDSTRRALDVTYAKAPDVKLFNETANFLTRNGLTAFTTPFPRFMFNSIELMGQYSGGAFMPAIQRVTRAKKGPLDAKDRQNISRHISGIVAFTAAYQYRTSENAPAEYKEINAKEGNVIDVTAQYPMRQFLWMAEAAKRLDPSVQKIIPRVIIANKVGSLMGREEEATGTGTFMDWFDAKEASETFLGASARTGASNVLISEISNILSDGGDLVGNEKLQKAAGRLIADYLTTWAIPITQVVEAQRATGYRPTTYVDKSTDEAPTIGGEIKRGFAQRGVSNIFTPGEEFAEEEREFVFSPDKKREGIVSSLLFGITKFTKDEDYGEYLTDKGFTEFEIGSRSRMASTRRAENKILQEYLPSIVDIFKGLEVKLRKEYAKRPSDDPFKKKYTEDQYINNTLRGKLQKEINKLKSSVSMNMAEDTSELAMLRLQYSKLTKAQRRFANSEFFDENNHEPSISGGTEDEVDTAIDNLLDLISYGQAM